VQDGRQWSWEEGAGVVVQVVGGFCRVATPDGRVLLCRARGRLRGREEAWREERDAERAEALLEAEGEPAEEELGPGRRRAALAAPVRPRRGRAGPGRRPEGQPAPEGEDDAGYPPVMAGDRVRFRDLGGGEGMVDEVLPRRTALVRPPVANADQVVVVVAWTAPPFSALFVDRVILEAALQGCHAVVCLNKTDLLGEAELARARRALEPWRAAGYATVLTSAVRGEGLDALRAALAGHLSVLAGPSGAGKSRLLAALFPGQEIRSGELSARLGRGRHTTRAVQLLALGPDPTAGWVADTPGFSRLELPGLAPEDLPGLYPEFRAYAAACRFRGCLHDAEPDCAVRAAVADGRLDEGRYARYRALLAEVRERAQR
jgi:ribosome biogenesis GTPase